MDTGAWGRPFDPDGISRGLASVRLQVVQFALDRPVTAGEAASLSDDERARADRFHRASDRHRFMVGRATVRAVLAQVLGDRADRLQMAYGPAGKPFIHGSPIPFNLTHSADRALLALSPGGEVGIDLEERRMFEWQTIADRFFTAPERDAIAARPPGERAAAFFTWWTLKEAYIKATSEGFQRDPTTFTVMLDAGGPRIVGDEPRRWALRVIDPAPAWAAAIAWEGAALDPECWIL